MLLTPQQKKYDFGNRNDWGLDAGTRLTCEHKPHPYRGVNDLFAHGFAGEIIEPVAGAMRRDQNIGIDLLKCLNCLADVVVAERRHDMKTADNGVHLVDPANP